VAEQADGSRRNEASARTNAYKSDIVKDAKEKAEKDKETKSRAELLRGARENRRAERRSERKKSAQTVGGSRAAGGVSGEGSDTGHADSEPSQRVPWPQDVTKLRELRERSSDHD